MCQLLIKTQELLKNRPRTLTLEQVAVDTGLSIEWLGPFGREKIDDPSVRKVVTLYEYLSGRKLEV